MTVEKQTYHVYQREYAEDDLLCTDEIGVQYIQVEAARYGDVIRQYPHAERVELPDKNISWYSTLRSQKAKTFDTMFHDILPDIRAYLEKYNLATNKKISDKIEEKIRHRYITLSHPKVNRNTLLQIFVEEYTKSLPKGKYKLSVSTFPSKATVEINGLIKQAASLGAEFTLLVGRKYMVKAYKKGFLLTEKQIRLNANGQINMMLKPEPSLEKKKLFRRLLNKEFLVRLKKDGDINVLKILAPTEVALFKQLHNAIEDLHTYKISYRSLGGNK